MVYTSIVFNILQYEIRIVLCAKCMYHKGASKVLMNHAIHKCVSYELYVSIDP